MVPKPCTTDACIRRAKVRECLCVCVWLLSMRAFEPGLLVGVDGGDGDGYGGGNGSGDGGGVTPI